VKEFMVPFIKFASTMKEFISCLILSSKDCEFKAYIESQKYMHSLQHLEDVL